MPFGGFWRKGTERVSVSRLWLVKYTNIYIYIHIYMWVYTLSSSSSLGISNVINFLEDRVKGSCSSLSSIFDELNWGVVCWRGRKQLQDTNSCSFLLNHHMTSVSGSTKKWWPLAWRVEFVGTLWGSVPFYHFCLALDILELYRRSSFGWSCFCLHFLF